MEQIDQLLTIAEISIALAGFSGIIATFQFRQTERVSRGQVVALSMIVNISLVGALIAVMPIALFNFGMSAKEVWSWSSLLMGINQLAFILRIYRTAPLRSQPPLLRAVYMGFFFVGTALGIALLVNAPPAAVLGDQFGPIFVTFIFNFGLVGFNFSRLLMYPLWRAVRQKEASFADGAG